MLTTLAASALLAQGLPGGLIGIAIIFFIIALVAYVLGARLALRQKDPDAARALLDTVVALNPNHTLARKLQQRAAAASAP